MLIRKLLLTKIYINLLLRNMLALNKSYYIINCNKTLLLSLSKKQINYLFHQKHHKSKQCVFMFMGYDYQQNKHFYAITEIKILAVYLYKYVKNDLIYNLQHHVLRNIFTATCILISFTKFEKESRIEQCFCSEERKFI